MSWGSSSMFVWVSLDLNCEIAVYIIINFLFDSTHFSKVQSQAWSIHTSHPKQQIATCAF